jgi:hypothetical protein
MTKRRFVWDSETKQLVEVLSRADLIRERERLSADVMSDLPEYDSPIDGRPVRGRAERREDLRRHRCRPYEEGERQEHERRVAAADAALDRRVGETVERWYYNASGEKREALAKALEMGLTTKYERGEPKR